MKHSATYIREGDQFLAFHGNVLIAHGSKLADVEKTAVEYLDNMVAKDKREADEKQYKGARFVETPNGLKGEILGNVSGVWGEDEITVRWENGRISRYETRGAGYKYTSDAPAEPESALEYLTKTLEADYAHDKQSLSARIKDLDGVVAKVAAILSANDAAIPAADQRALDQAALLAKHEQAEIREALAHLEQADYEAFAPPAPFRTTAVEQADLGGHTGSWLDETVNDMIREANDQDFDRLLEEGPQRFVADVDTAALADQGVTAQLAQTFIESKTAGLVGDELENYRKAFIAKVESARREELKDRLGDAKKQAKKAEKVKKKAKKDKTPDESLFL